MDSFDTLSHLFHNYFGTFVDLEGECTCEPLNMSIALLCIGFVMETLGGSHVVELEIETKDARFSKNEPRFTCFGDKSLYLLLTSNMCPDKWNP